MNQGLAYTAEGFWNQQLAINNPTSIGQEQIQQQNLCNSNEDAYVQTLISNIKASWKTQPRDVS